MGLGSGQRALGARPARPKRLREAEPDEGLGVATSNRETLPWDSPKLRPSARGL